MRKSQKFIQIRQKLVLCFTASILLLSQAACGNKAAFNVTPLTVPQGSAGSYTLPPKVDILLVQDNSGSIWEASSIPSAVRSFLTQLDSQGWDYHFAITPLVSYRTLKEVVGSPYDGNHPQWRPAFPGLSQAEAERVNPSAFRTLQDYTGYLKTSDISNSSGASEPGFDVIKWMFQNGMGSTQFLRSDALTVVLVMGNGNDSSWINYCKRSDGIMVPCEAIGNPVCTPTSWDPTGGNASCGSTDTSFNYYQTFFKSLPNARFYAGVANQTSNNCLGSVSRAGTRYQKMASALGGASFDICSASVNQVLSDLSTRLYVQRRDFKLRYLFVSQDANPDTIEVVRFVGGDPAQSEVIPRDPVNGWSYEGFVENVSAIYTIAPNGREVQMNKASGYAIRLHGKAELSGLDRADVKFKPAGARDSVSE